MRIVFCIPLALAFGCAHPQAQVKEASSAPSNGSLEKHQPALATTPTGSSTDLNEKDACGLVRVHFDFNSSQVAESDKPVLEKAALCLKQDHKLHVTVEGNADERGTEEYNLALGDHRARSVAKYLEALGASSAQLKTISYGKEQPECNDHDESCWAQNRRAAVRPTSFTR
jgi:peptidoglycan-associated lipoprotein